MSISQLPRTIIYVDGYNLYHGLVAAGWRKYLWLDLEAFGQALVRALSAMGPRHDFTLTKYFTSRINVPPESVKRQITYLDALATLKNVEVIEGRFEQYPIACHNCGHVWNRAEEKMTDVAITTHMLLDAVDNRYDTAVLVSADSDQCPPIAKIKARFADRRITVAFPPARVSDHLRQLVGRKNAFKIPEWCFAESQFGEIVRSATNYPLARPQTWAEENDAAA